jgi:polysaccharide pyruvyl transferase CsaB
MRIPGRPSVVLYGFYGYGNPGDEAVCRILMDKILARWPAADVCVMTADPERTRLIPGCRSRPKSIRAELFSLLRLLRKADALVFGGGTLIEARLSPLIPVVVLSILAKIFGTRVVLYGQGADYLKRPWHRLLVYPALVAVTVATVRDRESLTALMKMGLLREKMILSADEAAGLEVEPVDVPTAPYIAICPKDGVALKECAGERLVTAIASMGDEIVRRFGCQVILIPFQTGGRYPDHVLCRKIQAAMKETSSVLNTNSLTPRQIKSVLVYAKACVTMPLHAAIFAATSCIPVVGMSYASKVENFFNEVGLGRFVTSEVSVVCDLLREAITSTSENDEKSLKAYMDRVGVNFRCLETALLS